MKLLDLFSGAGGAAMGYFRAGFIQIIGVDIKAQPRYPFRFVQADALEYLAQLIETGEVEQFDLIHASPPCQANSALKRITRKDYIDLIPETRQLLRTSGRPYVIENVVGAKLIDPITLCGTQFSLKVYRHRLFECSAFLWQPVHFPHKDTWIVGDGPRPVRKGISKNGFMTVAGHGGYGIGTGGLALAKKAMNIDWMSRDELSQAIPPDYTEWIGRQLAKQIIL